MTNESCNLDIDTYEERGSKKFIEYEREEGILDRIEEVRQELNNIVNDHWNRFLNYEVINISEYLDKLLIICLKSKNLLGIMKIMILDKATKIL